MRVVLDTNVLISAFLSSGTSRRAFEIASQVGSIVLSAETILELAEVLWRSKFDPYTTDALRAEFLGRLCEDSEITTVTHEIKACRDPRDDKFLSLAVSGKADRIISGDNDLLSLDPFNGIRILTPAAFIAEIS